MRLLIDECLTSDCGYCFQATTAQTARFAKLAGLKNGQLLDATEAAGFDILVTVDQSMADQQKLVGRRISLVILCGPSTACTIWSY
jgi:hypothetical protein